MRTRLEIENSQIGRMGSTVVNMPKDVLILEVLLDIREILQDKILDDLAIKSGLKK